MEDQGAIQSRCNPGRRLPRWHCNWCQLDFISRRYFNGDVSMFFGLWAKPTKIFVPEIKREKAVA